MKFKDIPGLAEVKNGLISTVRKNHLAHALLFSGQEGGAQLALALALANYVNCENPGQEDACGQCASCVKNRKYIHPDLHFAFPVSSTKTITGKDVVSASFLKDWRQYLMKNPFGQANDWNNFFGGENKQLNISKEESRHIIRNLSLKTFEGKYKVMLVWLPEFMHVNAANAILKILEEPPGQTLFLLVTNQPERLLTTILSRSQPFPVRPFNNDEVAQYLVNTHQLEEAKAAQIAHIAHGNLNEALKLMNEVEDDSHKMFREWMRLCYLHDYTEMVQWAESFNKLSKLSQKSMLQYGLSILRETLVIHFNGSLNRLHGEEKAFVDNFSKVVTPEMIDLLNQELNHSFYFLERNANVKILFLDLSLSIAQIIRR
ncbi:MAG: ATP-binding protein [Candidatus Cyclobacteriaceae bacterium M3_2C_046]